MNSINVGVLLGVVIANIVMATGMYTHVLTRGDKDPLKTIMINLALAVANIVMATGFGVAVILAVMK